MDDFVSVELKHEIRKLYRSQKTLKVDFNLGEFKGLSFDELLKMLEDRPFHDIANSQIRTRRLAQALVISYCTKKGYIIPTCKWVYRDSNSDMQVCSTKKVIEMNYKSFKETNLNPSIVNFTDGYYFYEMLIHEIEHVKQFSILFGERKPQNKADKLCQAFMFLNDINNGIKETFELGMFRSSIYNYDFSEIMANNAKFKEIREVLKDKPSEYMYLSTLSSLEKKQTVNDLFNAKFLPVHLLRRNYIGKNNKLGKKLLEARSQSRKFIRNELIKCFDGCEEAIVFYGLTFPSISNAEGVFLKSEFDDKMLKIKNLYREFDILKKIAIHFKDEKFFMNENGLKLWEDNKEKFLEKSQICQARFPTNEEYDFDWNKCDFMIDTFYKMNKNTNMTKIEYFYKFAGFVMKLSKALEENGEQYHGEPEFLLEMIRLGLEREITRMKQFFDDKQRNMLFEYMDEYHDISDFERNTKLSKETPFSNALNEFDGRICPDKNNCYEL